PDGRDPWSLRILALGGTDAYDAPPADSLPSWHLLRLAPLLATRARTARTLEIALQDVLSYELDNVQGTIEQFVLRKVPIAPSERFRLGGTDQKLGVNTVVGGTTRDRTGKFRIVISPVFRDTFRRLLPGGDLMPLIEKTVTLFCRDPLDF